MKNKFQRIIILASAFCLFANMPGAAFWSSRVRATAEESILAADVGSPPTVYPIQADTLENIMIEIKLRAHDADGDAVAFRIDQAPKKGTAVIENDILMYTPADGKTGTDKFTYRALDVRGNCSEPAKISVKIQKNTSKLTYADMTNNSAHLAAVKLHEAGIFTGERIGDCHFFHPAEHVTRGEFIAMAVATAKHDLNRTNRTDFADDDALSPWLKPYISTAVVCGMVQGYPTATGITEIRADSLITYDEASSIICSMITPYLEEPVAAAAPSEMMHWAAAANAVLAANDMLPRTYTSGGTDPITRQAACELLYEAYRMIQ